MKVDAAVPPALAAAVQPIDRGPAAAASSLGPAASQELSRAMLSSWQYRVSGKAAVAELLQECAGEEPAPRRRGVDFGCWGGGKVNYGGLMLEVGSPQPV